MKRKMLTILAALSLGLFLVSAQGCYDYGYPGGYSYPTYAYGPSYYGSGHPYYGGYGWGHGWDHDGWGHRGDHDDLGHGDGEHSFAHSGHGGGGHRG
jgi:hypothetical protein